MALGWIKGQKGKYLSLRVRPAEERTDDPRSIQVLMIRVLIVGYVFAIRSERALCREVKVNLAYAGSAS